MTAEPLKTKQDSDRDLKTFNELPAKAKELVVLEDQAKKATGRERSALDQTIREKTQ